MITKTIYFTLLICSMGSFFMPGLWAQEEPKTEISLKNTYNDKDTGDSEAKKVTTPAVAETIPSDSTEIIKFVSKYEEVLHEPGLQLNLNDCIQMALLNNKEIKASDYDVEAAQWKLKEAQPRGVPTFEYEFLSAPAPRDVDRAVESFFEGDLTYFQRGKVAFGSPLYTFGKIHLAQTLAKSGISAGEQKRIQKKNDVVLDVKKLYYGVLLAKDMRDLLQDAVKHLEDEIQRRTEKEEPSDPVELVRLKLYRFEILSRLSNLEKKDIMAHHALRVRMGLPRGTHFQIVEDHIEPVTIDLKEFESYLDSSLKFQPKSRLVDIGLKAQEEKYRLEKRQVAPDIGFGGFYEFGVTTNSIEGLQLTDDFNDPFNFNRVGFGLRIKGELNPKRYRDKVKQAEAEYFKTAFNKRAADEGIELEIREAYLDVQNNKLNYENAREAMKTARQYVFLTKTNVDIGVGDKKDYSDALQAYLVSRGRYFEAVFNFNVAVATLEDKAGGVALLDQGNERE